MSAQCKAGFGKVDITPRVGVELAGYGPYLNRCSSRILEPLYARAMAVELGGVRWVIVSCDLIGFNAGLVKAIREIVRQQTDLRDEQIMVHATHTHSGPATMPHLIGWGTPDEVYLELLPRHIAQACIAAVHDLDDASFYHAEVDATGFSYNRELPDPGRTNELALNSEWKTDRPEDTDTTAHVIRVDRDGKTVGFLTYFSCHPVICGSRNHEIHGDFVGVATNLMEQECEGATGIFLQGALGDINSNFVHGDSETSLLALNQFSTKLAAVIRNGLQAARPVEIASLNYVMSDEPYHRTPPDRKELQKKLSENEAILDTAHLSELTRDKAMAMFWVKAVKTILCQNSHEEPNCQLTLQAFRLGPVTFTAAPVEIMHRIKRRFQAETGNLALLLSTTNGMLGYIPLREYFNSITPRYSVQMGPFLLGTTPFTENIEDEFLSAALKVAKQV